MIVSHKHKFIYLATSKTATNSCEKILGGYDECGHKKHSTLEILDFDFSDYFVCCFVRNPWDRLLSGYLQSKKLFRTIQSGSYRQYIYDLSNNNSLKNFLKLADERFWHDYDQSRYYLNKGSPIDFIGRFENLHSDLNTILEKIGDKTHTLPHYNKSSHGHYSLYYDDESKELVEKKYAKDIEYFGYKFGE
jgi:chondroitin 4-sulfotransferase 11